jgi:hypothetical protein
LCCGKWGSLPHASRKMNCGDSTARIECVALSSRYVNENTGIGRRSACSIAVKRRILHAVLPQRRTQLSSSPSDGGSHPFPQILLQPFFVCIELAVQNCTTESATYPFSGLVPHSLLQNLAQLF